MKSLNWNGLYANKFKRIGLIFAALFIVIEGVNRYYGVDNSNSINLTIYFIIYSLFLAIFSKEAIEDERIQIIRYFSLKQTFSIVILAILMTNISHSNFSYYSIIGSMLCYFPIFELTNYFNPDFIFKERTAKKGSETFVTMALTIGLVASVGSVIMHFLK